MNGPEKLEFKVQGLLRRKHRHGAVVVAGTVNAARVELDVAAVVVEAEVGRLQEGAITVWTEFVTRTVDP